MSASVQMINKIPKASKEKRSPAVDTERGAPGICFEQKRMWPSGQTNPTVWGLTVWLAWWSEQIRLDTDTIHLKYTSHSLNNWQLFTGTLTLAAGLTHKTAALLFVVQQATIWSVLYLIHKVSVSANLCPSSNTASNWTLLKKNPPKNGYKANRCGHWAKTHQKGELHCWYDNNAQHLMIAVSCITSSIFFSFQPTASVYGHVLPPSLSFPFQNRVTKHSTVNDTLVPSAQ